MISAALAVPEVMIMFSPDWNRYMSESVAILPVPAMAFEMLYSRLAPQLGRERFGDYPAVVARLLAVAASTTNRDRLARADTILAASFPLRGVVLRRWLADPSPDGAGQAGGLIFVRLSSARGALERRGQARGVSRGEPPSG